jgi:hypothetical protein
MKKLMLLMGLLLVTSLSFSQTVTKEEKMVNQDTIVSLKVPIAQLVIKDLIKGDGASLQVKELGNVVKLKDEQILLLKQKDTLQNQKISNLETIILKKDEQFSLEREKSEKLLKELKGQRAKTFLFKVGTFVGIVATSVLLIQR